jgi:exopolysaccharide biosynthesis polyprenyl glycosylphosphotransferase
VKSPSEKFPHISKDQLILFPSVILDFVGILIAGVIAFIIRFRSSLFENSPRPAIADFNYEFILCAIGVGWILILGLNGHYQIRKTNLAILNIPILVKHSILYFFAIGFLSFFLRASFSRTVFFVFFVAGLLNLITLRSLFFQFVTKPMIRSKHLIRKLAIVGINKFDANKYSDWIIDNRMLGFAVISRIECHKITREWLEEFERIIKFSPVNEILLLPGMEQDVNFSKFIHFCHDLEIKVNWIPLNSGSFGYWLIPSPQIGSPFLTFTSQKMAYWQKGLKRLFDILFSLSALLALSPILIVISAMILFRDGRPILYVQKRAGLDGKVFSFYKFRTMVLNADKMQHLAQNMNKNRHVIFKDANDPRITSIGKFLRRYSLDELPQFLNVLKNDMSIVGPRPHPLSEAKKYDSLYERRLNSKPGLTGPWQISGRSDLDLQTSVALDLNYAVNWSFTRDLWIVMATIGAVFRGRGAY